MADMVCEYGLGDSSVYMPALWHQSMLCSIQGCLLKGAKISLAKIEKKGGQYEILAHE